MTTLCGWVASGGCRYDSRLSRFAKARIVAELRRELQEDLASLKEDLVNRNDQAWKRIIKRPLGHAFKRLQAEAKSAWSSFLLVRTVSCGSARR